MVVLGLNPTRAGQATAQQRHGLHDVGWNFQRGKEAGHGGRLRRAAMNVRLGLAKCNRCDSPSVRCHRDSLTRAINCSTSGIIRSTITATPAAVGWSPSLWLSLGLAATPVRKNG